MSKMEDFNNRHIALNSAINFLERQQAFTYQEANDLNNRNATKANDETPESVFTNVAAVETAEYFLKFLNSTSSK
jgi:hypothetical protein